jgi:tetratricopeptide (TPR) repeat protein
MGCIASSEAAQTHHVLHHFHASSVANAAPTSPQKLQRVVGRISATDPHKMLNAPSSGRRCVYWSVTVWEEFWSESAQLLNSRPEWRIVLSRHRHCSFLLLDGTASCIVPETTDLRFRLAGNSFRQTRDTMEVPFVIQDMKRDPDYVWGQTYMEAGGVQTGLLQTGHYKVVEHTIAENDLLTVLCLLKYNENGQLQCYSFPKESVYIEGTSRWTKRDRMWWDSLFSVQDPDSKEFRMVVSNRPNDSEGINVPRYVGARCAHCTFRCEDAKAVRFPNSRHDKNCKLFAKPTTIVPKSSQTIFHVSNLKKLAEKHDCNAVNCINGHPLNFETNRGNTCSWCMVVGTEYHCVEESCKIDLCGNCYDLTRDSSAAEVDDDQINSVTIESMVALAPMLVGQKHFEKAEILYRRIIKGYKKIEGLDGEETLDTLLASESLANVLKLQGKMELAESTYRHVLNHMKSSLGIRSKNTLNVMDKLACLLYAEGKLNEAEALYKTVIKLEAEVLGKHHPATLTAVEALAEVYEKEGKIKEAIPVERRLLELRTVNMGVTHPKTEESREKLISLLKLNGQEDEIKKVRWRKQRTIENGQTISPGSSPNLNASPTLIAALA